MKTKTTIGSEPSPMHYGNAGNRSPESASAGRPKQSGPGTNNDTAVAKNANNTSRLNEHDEQIVTGAQASNLITNQSKKNNMKTANSNSKNKTASKLNSAGEATAKLKGLEKEADKTRTKSAGSQSNSSDRHNTGRGGGK
jgi:hypothetical protein